MIQVKLLQPSFSMRIILKNRINHRNQYRNTIKKDTVIWIWDSSLCMQTIISLWKLQLQLHFSSGATMEILIGTMIWIVMIRFSNPYPFLQNYFIYKSKIETNANIKHEDPFNHSPSTLLHANSDIPGSNLSAPHSGTLANSPKGPSRIESVAGWPRQQLRQKNIEPDPHLL